MHGIVFIHKFSELVVLGLIVLRFIIRRQIFISAHIRRINFMCFFQVAEQTFVVATLGPFQVIGFKRIGNRGISIVDNLCAQFVVLFTGFVRFRDIPQRAAGFVIIVPGFAIGFVNVEQFFPAFQ